ncbi:hypothetical protein CMV30_02815 [Nibricoccus aquaticus]|uniref:Uncharacterized protein n=2 Tax=Nibricoccus aquaticus TaxID=2576891 RepID=A0A290Q732_9BACT|nr:hypothetical protein CMV30_02815 [Nibricoccus aquaticus]
MKWVVLAIVIGLGTYTYVTLKFRKDPATAHRPIEDAKERFTVSRLRQAGYLRTPAIAERPADPSRTLAGLLRPLAEVKDAPAGVPAELSETFAELPKLPDSFQNVSAPASHTAMLPYSIQYVCQLPDNSGVLGETRVYVKDNDIAIITDFDRIDADLLARTKDATVLLQLPAGIFRSGETFQITLVGKTGSKHWTLQVH